jgi:hypothetical protein
VPQAPSRRPELTTRPESKQQSPASGARAAAGTGAGRASSQWSHRALSPRRASRRPEIRLRGWGEMGLPYRVSAARSAPRQDGQRYISRIGQVLIQARIWKLWGD